jgi:hypothetical protein
MFLGVLVVLVAVALGGTTYVMVEDSIREPTTTTQSDSSAGNATGPELVTPGGQQVAVAQSGQEVMLGMLKYLLEADPLQGALLPSVRVGDAERRWRVATAALTSCSAGAAVLWQVSRRCQSR